MGVEQLVAPPSSMGTRPWEKTPDYGQREGLTLKEEQLGTRRGELRPDGVRGNL